MRKHIGCLSTAQPFAKSIYRNISCPWTQVKDKRYLRACAELSLSLKPRLDQVKDDLHKSTLTPIASNGPSYFGQARLLAYGRTAAGFLRWIRQDHAARKIRRHLKSRSSSTTICSRLPGPVTTPVSYLGDLIEYDKTANIFLNANRRPMTRLILSVKKRTNLWQNSFWVSRKRLLVGIINKRKHFSQSSWLLCLMKSLPHIDHQVQGNSPCSRLSTKGWFKSRSNNDWHAHL